MIQLNEIGIEHIFSFKTKESNALEYLSAKEIAVCDEKRELFFSMLISAMANSTGGTIFIGIHAIRKIPKNIEPITNEKAVEWLTHICNTSISPIIPNLNIQKIFVSPSNYIIGIHVPNSSKAPHMCIDKRFYKRTNLTQTVLEEYEIRDLYTKSKRSEIELYSIMNTNGIPMLSGGKFQYINFYPRFLIKNTGTTVERFFKVEIWVPSQINNPNFDSLQNHFSRFEDGHSVFSITHKTPFFQNEIATVAEANFIVDSHNFDAFEHGEITIKLFFSNGIETKIFRCKELLLYKKKQLELSDFAHAQTVIETPVQPEQPRLFM
jgi:hypothetical protein